jgi:DNA adenine methylase
MHKPSVPSLLPLLKWVGGKRWLVPLLSSFWLPHRHRRLVEPFAGGLAIALGLRPKCALLNDANPHLINFYRQVQVGFSSPSDWRVSKADFYHYRDVFNACIAHDQITGLHPAQLFYYLNQTGFNGLCRFNRYGYFNVPFGTVNHVAFDKDFSAYPALLRSWHFSTFSVADLHSFVSPSDFLYADPPYDGSFTQYTPSGFSWADQVNLARWLILHRGPVVVSNLATPRVIRLYMGLGFTVRFLSAPRSVKGRGSRTPARELLAMRNLHR